MVDFENEGFLPLVPPPPLSGLVWRRVGVEMSQAGKGELSHKQARLTASTFPEARDLPQASRDCLNTELQNFMI